MGVCTLACNESHSPDSEAHLAVTMNIGPLVLTNTGPPPVFDLLSRAEARLSRSAALLCPPPHVLPALRWAVVRRNR